MLKLPTYPSDKLFSRQQVAVQTGIPDDVLGYWMREGLLISDVGRDGERKHRRFRFVQLHVAMLLNELRDFGVSIRALRSFADVLQRGIAAGSEAGLGSVAIDSALAVAASLHRFAAGEEVLSGAPGEPKRPARSEIEIASGLRETDFDTPEDLLAVARTIQPADIGPLSLYADLIDTLHLHDVDPTAGVRWGSVAWLAWPFERDNWTIVRVDADFDPTHLSGRMRSAIFLSVSTILHDLWNPRTEAEAI